MIPGFLLALLIVIVFAVNLRLFPATGFIPIQRSFSGWLATVTLPSISIALGGILGIALWVRASVIDLLRLDFVRTLRSRGISERTILLKHVLRNAAPPTLTIFGFTVIGLLSGVIFVERIYALPGLGQLALTSGQSGDIPAMLGVTSFMVVVVVFVNLAVDVANGILNPKSRLS
jgi:peptide/nickel transport system permease protein